MKKTICLIGMLLCLCVIGSAFAVAYYDAPNKTGTVTADSYLRLTLGGSTTNELVLEEDIPSFYTIAAVIDRSDNASSVNANAKVTITLADTTANSANNIRIRVFTNENRTTPLTTGGNDPTNVLQEGRGSIEITGLNATQYYYLTVEIIPKEGNVRYTADELAAIAGTMTVTFVRVTE